MDDLMQAVDEALSVPAVDPLAPAVDPLAPVPSASMAANLVEFTRLENRLRELEEEAARVKAQVGKVGAALMEQFADSGVQSANANGLCVYVRVDRFVSKKGGVPSQAVCDVLRKVGLAYMVEDGYNASSLKSKIKEYQDEGQEVPPELAELLNIGEVPRLAARKS